jgi:CheY-like chemotaxis protein
LGDRTLAAEAGLAAYILKPVMRKELLRSVGDAMHPRGKKDKVTPRATSHAAAYGRQENAPLRILIAEDSADNRFVLQAYLKETNHAVTFVEDGERAVEKAATAAYDRILMAVRMPIMNGVPAADALRAHERKLALPRSPILALTAHASAADIYRSLASGCDGHITKPISKQRLLAAIEKYARPELDDPLAALIPQYLEEREKDLKTLARLIEARGFSSHRNHWPQFKRQRRFVWISGDHQHRRIARKRGKTAGWRRGSQSSDPTREPRGKPALVSPLTAARGGKRWGRPSFFVVCPAARRPRNTGFRRR